MKRKWTKPEVISLKINERTTNATIGGGTDGSARPS